MVARATALLHPLDQCDHHPSHRHRTPPPRPRDATAPPLLHRDATLPRPPLDATPRPPRNGNAHRIQHREMYRAHMLWIAKIGSSSY